MASPMKTDDKSPLEKGWIGKTNLGKVAFWTIVFWGMIWALAPLLDRPVVQPIRNAWVLDGQGLASFPMWGYSLLIRLLGSVGMVVALQSVLGALATAALLVRLNCLAPCAKSVTTILFILALPWLSFMAYAYQMPISSAFMILALLAMEMAIESGRITWGFVAGALAALGQNFRSELLLLPGAVLVVTLIAQRLQWFRCRSIRPLAVCVGVALLLQMPWALNCYFHAGRFSLSESNLGHVAFIGLGNLPSNPWNIVPSDGYAQETVAKAGLDCSSLSFQGGDLLKRRFVEAVRQNPAAYAKCIGRRFAITLYRPFAHVYLAATPAEQRLARDLVRMIEPLDPFNAHTAPDTPEPTGGKSVSSIKVAWVVLYSLSQPILVRAVSLLGIVGFFLAMGHAPFQFRQPVVLCLGVALAYRFGMNVALFESGLYMTGVYLCYLPFAANTLWAISKWRRRSG